MQTHLAWLAALLTLVAASPSGAVPVRWVFEDAVFEDGGALEGSFVYDLDTNVYSQIAITTSAGTSFAGESYPADIVGFRSPTVLGPVIQAVGNLAGTTSLSLFFFPSPQVTGPGLTNAGGSVPLLVAAGAINGTRENDCISSDCQNSRGFRGLTAGSVFGTPLPEPRALLLGTLGLAALVRTRWRRRATRAWIRPADSGPRASRPD